jgi:hypothetical protein
MLKMDVSPEPWRAVAACNITLYALNVQNDVFVRIGAILISHN